MRKFSYSLFICCIFFSIRSYAQVDTSSYFPLGLWGIWVDHTVAPYGTSDPTTLTAPQWQKEQNDWSTINANYMVFWIPDWLEDTVMTITQPIGYRLDIGHSPCQQSGRPDYSLRTWIENTQAPLSDAWKAEADRRIDSIHNAYGSRSGFYSYAVAHERDFWAYDEVDTTWWPAIGYVIDRIKQIDSNHKSYVVVPGIRHSAADNYFPERVTLPQFAQRFRNLGIFQVDDYEFTPSVSKSYTNQQSAIDTLLLSYQACMNAFKGGPTEWQAVIQTQREYVNSQSNMVYRRPNLYEVKVQAYLALSRGAKGITSYLYGSIPIPPGIAPNKLLASNHIYQTNDVLISHGLVNLTRDPFTADNDAEQIPGFSDVSAVYSEIKLLAPVIRKLQVYDAFPNTAISSNNIANITSVSGDRIEIGVFKRVDQGTDSTAHFMLVNRVCNNQDGSLSSPQNVTVAFSNSVAFGVSDVATGDIWLVSPNGNFTVSMDPGKGRLFAKMTYQAALQAIASQGKSTVNTATQRNNQRKLFSDPSTGRLHEVFASGGEIFARYSDNSGSTWSAAIRLSDGTGVNYNPSITGRNNNFGWYSVTYVYVVWDETYVSGWNIAYNFSTNNGASWLSNPYALANTGIGAGVFPALQASRPGSYSFDLRIVYPQASGLMSAQTSNTSPAPANWSFYSVPGATIIPQNPSLTYTVYGYYTLVYSDNYNGTPSIFSQNSSGYGWSTTRTNVSAGAYMVSSQGFPSVDLTSTNDEHIGWEGTYNGYRVLLENKNLSSYYNLINVSGANCYGASVSGNNGDKATVLCYDNSNRIWYTYVVGGSITGVSQIGSSGAYPSVSVCNPQGGSEKAVWTGQTASPYYAVQTATQSFQKTELTPPLNSERWISIVDTTTQSAISIGIGSVVLTGANGIVYYVSMSPFAGDDASIRSYPWSYLTTQSFVLPEDADSVQVENIIVADSASQLAVNGTVTIDVLSSADSTNLVSFGSSHVVTADGRVHDRIPNSLTFAPFKQRLAGKSLFLRLNVKGFKIPQTAKISLVNVFRLAAVGQLAKSTSSSSDASQTYSTAGPTLSNFPNPFNPTTILQYRVDSPGHVFLVVYDILGREVVALVNSEKAQGIYNVAFDASKLPSGIYISKLECGGKTSVQKMLFLK